jgi:spermidine/putrescine transport system permease protein
VLHPDGSLKTALVFFGLIQEQTNLLYNNVAVFVVMVYSYLPFAIIPLYSAASKFNFRLFEAAMDLGATRKEAFFKIFLPFMRPAILTAALLVLIPTAGAYVIPDVVGGQHSEMLGNLIARKVFIDRDLPQASVLAILLSFIIFVPAFLLSRCKSRLSIPAQTRGDRQC